MRSGYDKPEVETIQSEGYNINKPCSLSIYGNRSEAGEALLSDGESKESLWATIFNGKILPPKRVVAKTIEQMYKKRYLLALRFPDK